MIKMMNIFKLPVDGKGVEADVARSSNDWYEFKLYHKHHNPIRYFLNNEFESMFIWPWSMRLEQLADWVKYRTTKRYHIVKTGMKPGYSDTAEKMLHVNFNMLKDFVEIEKAQMFNVFGANDDLKLNNKDAGIAHLVWEMGLENEVNHQAENAREIYDLYNWWINERPLRVDPMETPEHNAYWKLREEVHGDEFFFTSDKKDTAELKKAKKISYALSEKLENQYNKEDEKNLVRLMKIRDALWT